MTFEENLSALSEITKKLEEGTLTLEESSVKTAQNRLSNSDSANPAENLTEQNAR